MKCRLCGRSVTKERELCYKCELKEKGYIVPYKSPCKKCKDRSVTCHSECEVYQAYADYQEYMRQKAYKEKRVDRYIIERCKDIQAMQIEMRTHDSRRHRRRK